MHDRVFITGKAKKPERALNLRDYINSVFSLQVKVKKQWLNQKLPNFSLLIGTTAAISISLKREFIKDRCVLFLELMQRVIFFQISGYSLASISPHQIKQARDSLYGCCNLDRIIACGVFATGLE